ncbi:MAG: FtsX-like permease family protein [Rhodothermaceae bacterium]
MKFPLFVSKRFLSSGKGSKFISLISFISIAGVALGVAVLIIALTVLNGFEKAISKKIIDFDSHIKITAFGKRNLPSYKKVKPELEKMLHPYGKNISPFLSKEVMINNKQNSDGIVLSGVLDGDSNSISNYINKGSYQLKTSDGKPAIVVGLKLAEKLDLNCGDQVTVFSLRNDQLPSYNNPPGIMQFTVTGIFESGMAEYDDLIAYTNLNDLQQLTESGDKISGYNIQLNDINKIDSLTVKLADLLPYPYYPKSIYRVHSNIFNWIALQKVPVPLVLSLITIVACFNMVGTILMIVLEKTSHIGVLKSIGANNKSIKKIFISQGLYLSAIGIAAGNIIALTASYLQLEFNLIPIPDSVYFISSVPISIDLYNYLIVNAAAFLLCYLASFIPSYVASKMSPVNLIRFN